MTDWSEARCHSCVHWVYDAANPGFGFCYKRGPFHINSQGMAVWPRTDESDRCGDHRRVVLDAAGAAGRPRAAVA